MLSYFYNYKGIKQIERICQYLNELKERLEKENYKKPKEEYNLSVNLFDEVTKIAIKQDNENLANSQCVFKAYFELFTNLMSYFSLLSEKRYKDSWNKLQDCIDDAQFVGKFSENRFDIPDILELLYEYEKLYPYKIFVSSEFIINKSHCTICGKSMQSLECEHRIGNIYWGQVAKECVDNIKELQAVCIVKNPENKRCVMEPANDNREESEKFKKLDLFLQLNLPRLERFSLESVVEIKSKEKNKIGRNNKCPCGSKLKYKMCCGKELYYKNEKNKVIRGDIVKLFIKSNN